MTAKMFVCVLSWCLFAFWCNWLIVWSKAVVGCLLLVLSVLLQWCVQCRTLFLSFLYCCLVQVHHPIATEDTLKWYYNAEYLPKLKICINVYAIYSRIYSRYVFVLQLFVYALHVPVCLKTAGHRRTPQDTAGRPCNYRRTPKWPILNVLKNFYPSVLMFILVYLSILMWNGKLALICVKTAGHRRTPL